jgi:hypothetical protein
MIGSRKRGVDNVSGPGYTPVAPGGHRPLVKSFISEVLRMEFVTQIHSALSNTARLFFLLLGLWGLFRAVRNNGVDGSYMGALVIGEALFVLQAILGVILLIDGARPGRMIHLLYGAFAVVALPGLFAYMKGDDSNRAQWLYAILTLFLFGVTFRSIGTGI